MLTDDVDSAYAEAQELGFEIVRPLTTEAWGVRRLLVRAPDGNGVNIVKDYTRLSPDSAWHEGADFGWVGDAPAATDTGLFDVVRRGYVRDSAPSVLRLRLPAGRCTAHLLTGDPNTFNRPLIVRVDGNEKARREQLDGREFTWLRVPLDGGPSGGEVDLELSSRDAEPRHLSACVVVADGLGPVSE